MSDMTGIDEIDAFDGLYRSHERAVAILTAAQEVGESAGADDTVLLLIETALDVLREQKDAWDVVERAVSGFSERVVSMGGVEFE